MTPFPTRRPLPRRWLLAALLLLCLLLGGCASSHTVTIAEQSDAETWTRPLTEEPLRQTFTVTRPGLSEIELVLALPAAAPALPSRPLHWALRANGPEAIREGTIETASFLNNTPIRLAFAPLATSQYVELSLTAAPEAQLAFWSSESDRYHEGTLLDNKLDRAVDLAFTLRATERPLDLVPPLQAAAVRWRGVTPWIPLLLIGPGWLLAWLLGAGERRALAPHVAALSLGLAPFVYLGAAFVGLRLYEPLVQSLFQASVLTLLLLLLRQPERAQRAWKQAPYGALALLALYILGGIVTWLLAGRALLAPPGAAALPSGILAQNLVSDGLLTGLSAPLPVAAITATLTQLSRQPTSMMLLLSALLLGVTTIPSLYALAAEVTLQPQPALWLLPLAWLWPAPWAAFAQGDLLALYSLALMPVAVALGARALRSPHPFWQAALLAALPLAALALVQGVGALGAWTAGVALALTYPRRARRAAPDEAVAALPHRALLARAGLWLLFAIALLLPAWFRGATLSPALPLPAAGYDWLLAILLAASLVGWLGPRLRPYRAAVTLLLLLALPGLVWMRSAPVQSPLPVLGSDDIQAQSWVREQTKEGAIFLLNAEPAGDSLRPTDAGAWLPLYGRRRTVQQVMPPELWARAVSPRALTDPSVREELLASGVTHLYLGGDPGPITLADVLDQAWARVLHQFGTVTIIELSR